MLSYDRGKPDATGRKELWEILKLTDACKNDGFCDLGCGYGNLCRWAIQKVGFAIGIEDYKKHYNKAKKSTKKIPNITILKDDYRKTSALKKARKCNIFYTTNGESLGFYEKFQRVIAINSWLVTFAPPPYPIKPLRYTGLLYAVKTPFKLAKTKKEWLKSISKDVSLKDYQKRYLKIKYKKDFDEDKLTMLEDIDGLDWVIQNRK